MVTEIESENCWRREAMLRHLALDKSRTKIAKPSAGLGANGFALTPDAVFREGIVGAVELAMGGKSQSCVPHAVGADGSNPTN